MKLYLLTVEQHTSTVFSQSRASWLCQFLHSSLEAPAWQRPICSRSSPTVSRTKRKGFTYTSSPCMIYSTLTYIIRTKTFGYLNATSQFFLLLGPVIASSTMSIGLLAPIWISVVVNLLSSLIVVLLPDTRQSIHRQSDASNDNPRPAEQEALLPGSSGQVSLSSERFSLTNFLGTIKRTVLRELQAMRLLFAASRNVRLCLLVLLVTRLGASSIDILIQYISIRYGWTYAEVNAPSTVPAKNLTLDSGRVPVLSQSSRLSSTLHHFYSAMSEISYEESRGLQSCSESYRNEIEYCGSGDRGPCHFIVNQGLDVHTRYEPIPKAYIQLD